MQSVFVMLCSFKKMEEGFFVMAEVK